MPGIARSHNKQNHYISIFKNAYSNLTWQVGLPFRWGFHSQNLMNIWSKGLVRSHYKLKYISINFMLMVTKLGRVVIYHEGSRSTKTHDRLATWSCKITYQTKTIESLLPQPLWPTSLAGWRQTKRSNNSKSCMIL